MYHINYQDYTTITQGVIALNRKRITEKIYSKEELQKLIESLRLYDIKRENFITVAQFLFHLKVIGTGYKLIEGDKYYIY